MSFEERLGLRRLVSDTLLERVREREVRAGIQHCGTCGHAKDQETPRCLTCYERFRKRAKRGSRNRAERESFLPTRVYGKSAIYWAS